MPPDFAVVAAIVALGALIGRKIGIRPKCHDNWTVVANLWGFAVGRPGQMKTPAVSQALTPLQRLAKRALEKHDEMMQVFEADGLVASHLKKVAEKNIEVALKKGDKKAAYAIAEEIVATADETPVLRRYVINDSTVPKLGELLAKNPNGLLVHRDELVGFLRSMDKDGYEESRAFFLEAWNGDGSFTFDRIGRGTVRVESNTVSIIGCIQPDLLSNYVREAMRGGTGADGLLQRFQVAVWPDTSTTWSNVDRPPDAQASSAAHAIYKFVDDLTPEAAGAALVEGEIAFLRFTPAAQEVFSAWREKLEVSLRAEAEHPAFESHMAKYRKLVPALALILHLANRDTGPVTLTALEMALHWADYLESHARRIYSAVLRPDSAAARELAKHIQRGDLGDSFTLRETYRKGWAALGSKEDAEAATEILCDLGWIRQQRPESSTTGRPPSPTFTVNPKVPRLHDREPTKPTK